MTETENALLMALDDMARQHCYQNAKTYQVDSGAISANADALELLARHGRFVIHRGTGRMVCGYWPEDADKFQPRIPAGQTPIYYMRDNHTFRRLPNDVEGALAAISEEYDAGYKHGMLHSSPNIKDTEVQPLANESKEDFLARCRTWLAARIKPKDLFVELSKLEVAFGDAKVRTVTELVEDSVGVAGR